MENVVPDDILRRKFKVPRSVLARLSDDEKRKLSQALLRLGPRRLAI
jgi:hypothetical protein